MIHSLTAISVSDLSLKRNRKQYKGILPNGIHAKERFVPNIESQRKKNHNFSYLLL